MNTLRPLTFSLLDDLAFAAERGRLTSRPAGFDIVAEQLGPFLEYTLLSRTGLLPQPDQTAWLALNGVTPMYSALTHRRHHWVCPSTRRVGIYRLYARPPADDATWVEFCVAAQHAAAEEGFPKTIAAQLAGAMGEMESNIYEHSQAPQTGIAAFKAIPGTFEFVVADSGIGVLKSLQTCSEYANLTDHGEALRLAQSDGVSRHGSGSGHGNGFRPLFTGLANLNGALRFRSGDHALTIEGQNPCALPVTVGKKASIKGFLVSVLCRV